MLIHTHQKGDIFIRTNNQEIYIIILFRGRKRPDAIREYFENVANNHFAVAIFNYKWTTVFHCKWDSNSKPVCKIATEEKFLGANGITLSPDGKTVFVNDPLDMNIMALSRNVETGELTKKIDISTNSI